MFSTPYTASGKAHGELDAQYIRKTILTTQDSFPYVKKRSKIIQVERIELIPLEVAILNMQDKTKSLRHAVQQDPPDTKLLQMQLQGGIATAVNQVSSWLDCVTEHRSNSSSPPHHHPSPHLAAIRVHLLWPSVSCRARTMTRYCTES